MIELMAAGITIVAVAVVVAVIYLGQQMLSHMDRQAQAHAAHLNAQAESHTSQVAALVEVIKSPPLPPFLAPLAGEPEESVKEVDEQFAESGAGVVQWDPVLAPLPGIDD